MNYTTLCCAPLDIEVVVTLLGGSIRVPVPQYAINNNNKCNN